MIDLDPTDLETVQGILHRHIPNTEVRAFGSRITDEAREYSDLDIVIVGDSQLANETLSALRDAFSASNLPIMVDLHDWQRLSERFQKLIAERFVVIQNARE